MMNRDALQGAIGVILSQKFGCSAVVAMDAANDVLNIVVGSAQVAAPPTQATGPTEGQAPSPLSQLQSLQDVVAKMRTQIDQLIAAAKPATAVTP